VSTDYENQLANSLSESIRHMSGKPFKPRQRCAICAVIGAVLGYGLGIASLFVFLHFAMQATA